LKTAIFIKLIFYFIFYYYFPFGLVILIYLQKEKEINCFGSHRTPMLCPFVTSVETLENHVQTFGVQK